MADAQQNMLDAIDSLVSRRIDSTPIDLTITATVARLHNAAIGEYKVTYQSNTFSAYSLDPLTVYRQGQEVYVLVPRGDFSSQKVILGEAAFNDKVTYADRQAMQNQWRTVGPNWLAPEWYWRNSDGTLRDDIREGGICVYRQGVEAGGDLPNEPHYNGIGSKAAWRRYIFYRPGFLKEPMDEEGKAEGEYTPVRWSKTRWNGPKTFNVAGEKALSNADIDLQNYGTYMDYIMVSANFQTLLLNTHSSGEYGVMVECFVENPRYDHENNKTMESHPGEPKYLIATFKLSFGDFNGARYSFATPTPQRGVFAVPRGVIKGLARVSVYQTNGWDTDISPDPKLSNVSFKIPDAAYVENSDNIIASNIQIHWCEPINLTEKLFWLKIDAIKGTSLYDSEGATNIRSIPLRARLMYGAQDVTDRNSCKFVWFRQKYSALRSIAEEAEKDEFGNTWAGYLPEGEEGWAPIDLMMKPIGNNTFAEYIPAAAGQPPNPNYRLGSFASESAVDVNPTDNFQEGLIVPIEMVPWQWKYMVVCYYNPGGGDVASITRSNQNDALVWGTQVVKNRSSIYDFELPPVYMSNLSELNLRVKNNIVPWETNEDGTMVPFDVFDPKKPDPEKDWWGRWWALEGRAYNAMQDTITQETILNDKRYVKGAKRIDHWATNSPITFKVQVFGSRKPQGTNLEEKNRYSARWPEVPTPSDTGEYPEYEIANLERALIPNNDSLVHVTFHGNLSHYYNSNGSLRDFGSNAETQYNIWATITPRDDTIRVFSVEWLTPDNVPISGSQNKAHTMQNNNGMCHFIWSSEPDQRRMVHYKVEQTYDTDKVATERNTFKLRLRFVGDSKPLDIECPITFITADGNGANGTEWEATIWPTNNTPSLDNGNTVSRTPWTWDVQNHPRPLVCAGNYKGGSNSYTPNTDYQLFLRPFIKRKNVPIEDLTESHRYTYKVYWDVRYPTVKADNNRAKVSKQSFLTFDHRKVSGRDFGISGQSSGAKDPQPDFTVPKPVQDAIFQAYTHSRDQQGNAWTANGEDYTANPSLPHWRPTDQATKPRTFGAIEVRWRGLEKIDGVSFVDLNYSFVVKAQIDIFYDNHKVQTIFSYHGVDIVFEGGIPSLTLSKFTPSMIKTTWPKEVKYSPTGIAPVSRSEYLQFYYGPNREMPQDGPPPHPISAEPINLTPGIQDLSLNGKGLNPRGKYSSTAEYRRTPRTNNEESIADVVYYEGSYYKVKNVIADTEPGLVGISPDQSSFNDPNWSRITDQSRQILLPRPFYFFDQFDNGALATDIIKPTGNWQTGVGHNLDFTTWTNAVNEKSIPDNYATYVRTIIYRLSQFANDDINGWDGKSIDLNEKNGTIFAPTIGAGWKHPFTNTFTGVIMGIDKSQLRNAYAGNYGGFSGEAVDQMKYMVGLYGYQDGVNSFGILENGTAFFGRADRGGRIIIDGYNAQIYGGISIEKKTGLDANMRNRMRLSFIDFGGSAAYQNMTKPDGSVDMTAVQAFLNSGMGGTGAKPTQGLDVDGQPGIQMDAFPVEGGDPTNPTPAKDKWFGNFRSVFAPGKGLADGTGSDDLGEDPLAAYYGGYTTGHGFSTPAIEIGSYEDWVRKDGSRVSEDRTQWRYVLDANANKSHPYRTGRQLVRQLSIPQVRDLGTKDEIKLLEIPGFRRFLVTYDGTLYAMNAFIMGTIIGSNIIGSQFFTDTGAGVMTNYGFYYGFGDTATVKEPLDKSDWSKRAPTVYDRKVSSFFKDPKTREEFEAMGNKNRPGSGAQFALGIDGTVVANKMHITGGSISVGSFHVIDTSDRYGDVISYGTMHLVGPNINPYNGNPVTWEDGGTAVEAWGNFYLRGKLTNLGEVYLGAAYEKKIGNGVLSGRSMNSPVSIVPSQPSAGWEEDRPMYPVEIGLWPLYARVGHEGKLPNDKSTNNSWIVFASSASSEDNGYMPTFARRTDESMISGFIDSKDDGPGKFAPNVTWRLDQLGTWTDGMIFSAHGGDSGATTMNNRLPLTLKDHGFGYMGWWSSNTYAGNKLIIKNVNAKAPSIAMETPRHIRISSGKEWTNLRNGTLTSAGPDDYNTILIDTWAPGTTGVERKDRGAALMLGATGTSGTPGFRSAMLSNAVVMALECYKEGSSNETGEGLEAFLHLNGIGVSGKALQDEYGRDIGRVPNYDPKFPGRIWMKGVGVAIEAAKDTEQVGTHDATSTFRLNRSWDGGLTSAGMPKDDEYSSKESREGSNFSGWSSGTIMIKSSDASSGSTDTIHIRTSNAGADGVAGNEIFLSGKKGLIRITATEEFSFGIGEEGHKRPTKQGFFITKDESKFITKEQTGVIITGDHTRLAWSETQHLTLTGSEIRITGYTAEQQFGIYARFA